MLFEVICDDEELIIKAISLYNQTYKTNFALVEYKLDEVNFAVIEASNIGLSDIYDLGILYGRLSATSGNV